MAEIVGTQALSFIAADPEHLARFLVATGLGPGTIRAAAEEPDFLRAVLDFILENDDTTKAFAESVGLPPHTIDAARLALGEPPWESDVP